MKLIDMLIDWLEKKIAGPKLPPVLYYADHEEQIPVSNPKNAVLALCWYENGLTYAQNMREDTDSPWEGWRQEHDQIILPNYVRSQLPLLI